MKLLTTLIFFVLSACLRAPLSKEEPIIGKVNGMPIYLKEFLINYQQLKSEQDEITQKNPKLIEQLKLRAFNETIINGVLRQEATQQKIHIAKEEVEGRLSNWKDGYPPGGFEEMLRKQNTTEDFLKKRIEDQLLIEKVSESLFSVETRISDDETKSYFKNHEREFARPEKVHVFQIVVPTKEEAEKIRQEILAGKLTFESAARQYSLSPDSAKGGDLGFFSKDEKIPAFNDAFTLNIGTVSKPIQSPYGIHLLRVVEKQLAKKLNYNEAKSDIVKVLKKAKEVKAYREWVTKLLKDGEIYRNEVLFAQTS